MKLSRRLCLIAIALGAGIAQSAGATQIGYGAGLVGADSLDSSGARTNVTDFSVLLSAGTYTVESFEFQGEASGYSVLPFLATLTGTDQYTPLWVGSSVTANTGSVLATYVPGTQQFTLLSAATVFAGFQQSGPTVSYYNNGPSPTDHGAGPGVGDMTIAVGVPTAVFSSPDLDRTYAYAVNVVPEPATALLLAAGLAGLAAAGRRRSLHSN